MIVGVLTTCHTHNTLEIAVCSCTDGSRNSQSYVPPLPTSIPEMKVRIRTAVETITADMLQTVWNELDYHVDVCRITQGAHIEHL
jgi:hypothetical protein